MTLTTHRPNRQATRPSRPVDSQKTALEQPARLVPLRALDDVYRVECNGRTVGYVQVVGPVFVTLEGGVYNTSVEISQCHDLDTAVARLASVLQD
jgi:hypothetical protein